MILICLFLVRIYIGELEILVNREMKHAQVWLANNQLTLNLKKTNYIILKYHKKNVRKNNKLPYNFRDIYILNSQLQFIRMLHGVALIIYISSFTEQTTGTIEYRV